MNLEAFKRDIKTHYHDLNTLHLEEKVARLLEAVQAEWERPIESLDFHELRTLVGVLLDEHTLSLRRDIDNLLTQKERIERQLIRKQHEVQHLTYALFDALETQFPTDEPIIIDTLHHIKMQSVDLLDILDEISESALIAVLEHAHHIEETTREAIKEITFEAINANVINAIRVRRLFIRILQSALNVAEADPNHAHALLRGTILGGRDALLKTISAFNQYLMYIPDEVKALHKEEYQIIEEELSSIDTFFDHVILALAHYPTPYALRVLDQVRQEISFENDELTTLARATARLLRERLSKIANQRIGSDEAKKMGRRVWSIAKSTVQGAIRGAKEAMEP